MSARAAGHAIAFCIASGQAHGLPYVVPLRGPLPGVPQWAITDRGYTGHRFRESIWNMAIQSAIAPQRTRGLPGLVYNRVERHRTLLKEWRAVATQHEKTAASFADAHCLAATLQRIG